MAGTIEDLLAASGLTAVQIESAKAKANADKISLMYALENMNLLPEDKIVAVFAQFYEVQVAKLQDMEIPQNIIQLIPGEIAEKSRVIPIDRAGNNIIVALANPKNTQVAYSIRFKTGYNVKAVLASERRLTEALEKYYSNKKSKNPMREFKKNEFETNVGQKPAANAAANIRLDIGKKNVAGDGPIIKLVNDILLQCVNRRGSDIHIEPYENAFRIRLRVDGGLEEIFRPPVEIKDALTSRVKIMSGMDIAEKRLPQDGGIRVTIGDKPIDFRVNTLPTIFGEKIVLRLLDKSALQVDMTSLGFEQQELERFMLAIHEPHGMVLVTGPTGSGKTTTLYSALNELNKISDNIVTAEDPVEYNLEGINQVQIKPDIGLDFSAALKAFLRQDPDIIMVGEIRDLVTAEIAIKAALTGHLVMSTLHTNSAAETIVRMRNMGVESFNIASSLNCVVAQRLTKKICEKCRVVDELVTPDVLISLGVHPSYADKVKAYKGKGCEHCNFNGTRGRVALHELLVCNEEIKEGILSNANAIELRKIAIRSGMRTLRQAALNKMVQGIINSQEVVSHTTSDVESENHKAVA